MSEKEYVFYKDTKRLPGSGHLGVGGSKTPLPSADFLNFLDRTNLLQLFLKLNKKGGRKSVVYFLV